MTNYLQMERDFIERTLQIIDQYEELRKQFPPDNQYEVTLLMNCVLGLLVYPQQIASKPEFAPYFNRWLTADLVVNVGREWGITPHGIKSAGYKNGKNKEQIKITLEQLTLRNLIRQMRNTAAHAAFYVNDISHQIECIEFRDASRPDGFHIVVPVSSLSTFVIKLAESALNHLPKH